MGLNTAGIVIIGQCFGAGKIERIKKTFWMTLRISLISWVVMAVPIFLFPVQLFKVFTSDESVLAFAPQFIRIYIISMLGMACSEGACALFEGVGATKLEMVAGIVENLGVKILVCMMLGSFLGLTGFWLGKAFSALVTPVAGFIYYFSGLWKKRKADWIENKDIATGKENYEEKLLDNSTGD
jgi:Na+-driven multidrug efflux pump